MKKKYSRILGVVLVLALLASIFSIATPVAAADVQWTGMRGPGVGAYAGNVVLAGSDVSLIAVSPDGSTIFAVDKVAIYRSTNGGVTWTAASSYAGTAPVAMVVSPQFDVDATVIVASATSVYKSTNGGITFPQMSTAVTAMAPNQIYTSLAISPTYQFDGLLLAGTVDTVGAQYGTVYVFGSPGTFGWKQFDGTFDQDVTSVAFSPNFPLDFTVLAVGTVGLTTTLNASVNWTTFGTPIGAATIPVTSADIGDPVNPTIISSTIALPSDYNGIMTSLRRAYVGVVSNVVADNEVYRVTGATAVPLGMVAVSPSPARPPASLAYSGTYSAGTLFVGDDDASTVRRLLTPTTATAITAAWIPSMGPTGGSNTQIALAHDFATSNRIYVGTTGPESAVSVSNDGGSNWYQSGLIDTVLNTIVDVTPSPAYATDSTVFLVTEPGNGLDAIVNTADDPESLWKSVDGGSTWMRINLVANILPPAVPLYAIVRLSPDFATDQTVTLALMGGTTGAILTSSDAGTSWGTLAFSSPRPIADLVVESPTNLYVAGSGGGVSRTVNSGWTWLTATGLTTAGALFSIMQASNGDIFVGTTASRVFRSTDSGVSFTTVGAATGLLTTALPAVATNTLVVSDGTNVYSGGPAGAGVFRFRIGTDTAWAAINTTALLVAGLAVGADGTLYAADATAVTGPTVGGIMRSLNPASPAPPTFERVSSGTVAAGGDNLTVGATITKLTVVEGSNLVIAMSPAAGSPIYTYNDTLTVAPVLTLTRSTTKTATFSWEALPGATAYHMQANTRSDFRGTLVGTWTYVAGETSGTLIGLTAGRTYYVQLRAGSMTAAGPPQVIAGRPALSAWSDRMEIKQQMATVETPLAIGPVLAAQDVALNTALSWTPVLGAASYSVEIADNADFTDATIGSTAINAWQPSLSLDYSTTYYWRVSAVSATGAPAGTPIIGVFTTMDEPAPPAPTEPPVIEPPDVIVDVAPPPAPPPADITIQPADVTVESATPTWALLVIIIIGAVLIISVIILIVRTRRPV